ncbi:hypothetical protein BXO87_01960 [Bacillus sp. GZB]|uniref:thymidine kinase n=1 Tax=Bacillus sp. GZB TaxID=936599 RepID=UPI0009764885|nr:hypothetical protein [Bacillus sp. GZB]OMQ06795.1 hypothetical protein BXO87_01960 [Bacillus sp. GZB]
MAGNLVTTVGVMGSGKTKKLIQLYRELKKSGLEVKIFKPTKDIRSGNFNVESRDGDMAPAQPIQNIKDIFEYGGDTQQAILIDEIQFFDQTDLVHSLVSVCLLGIDVYCFGLDLTSDGTTFGLVGDVMAKSDEVIKLKGACARCGSPARVTRYKGQDKTTDIRIGDLDVYEPVCMGCFYSSDVKGMKSSDNDFKDPLYAFKVTDGESGFSMELQVKKSRLMKAGYTYEDVADIVTEEGAKNLLADLGIVEEGR